MLLGRIPGNVFDTTEPVRERCLISNNISVNDAGEHIKINNFLLAAPKILILGSKIRA